MMTIFIILVGIGMGEIENEVFSKIINYVTITLQHISFFFLYVIN